MATIARSKYTLWLMILLSIAIALYAVAFQLRLAGARRSTRGLTKCRYLGRYT